MSISAKNSQMASTHSIFTSTYHAHKAAKPNSSGSHVVNYTTSYLLVQKSCESFKDHPSTCGHLTNLRNKPQQEQTGQP